MPIFCNQRNESVVTTKMSVADLNKKLATRSYLEGYSLSDADKNALAGLSGVPDKTAFPHAYRWAIHIINRLGAAK